MVKNEDEALRTLAEVKGYLDDLVAHDDKCSVVINIMVTKLSSVQLFINPKADINEIQEEVNRNL